MDIDAVPIELDELTLNRGTLFNRATDSPPYPIAICPNTKYELFSAL